MPATIDDIDIANNALARIGERALTSLDEDTPLAGQVNAIYHDVVDAAFACYQWKWPRRTEALQSITPPAPAPLVPTPPLPVPALPPQYPYQGFGPAPGPQSFNGWPYGFSFPTDALSGPLGLYISWPSSPLRDFAVEGRVVFARVPGLYGTFVRRLGPSDWPPLFRLGVSMWVAAELAIPVTHDKDFAAQLMQAASGSPSEQQRGGMMGRAISMDVSTGGAPAAFSGDPVTEARYQGCWYGDT